MYFLELNFKIPVKNSVQSITFLVSLTKYVTGTITGHATFHIIDAHDSRFQNPFGTNSGNLVMAFKELVSYNCIGK